MKLSCSWFYAGSRFGYPMSLQQARGVINDIARMGFRSFEFELEGEQDLRQVWQERRQWRARFSDAGLSMVNFCPVIPDPLNPEKPARERALELFRLSVGLAAYFGCETIRSGTHFPPMAFLSDRPHWQLLNVGERLRVKVSSSFRWDDLWAHLIDTFSGWAELAQLAGLRLCLEPRVGEISTTTDGILRILDAVGNESMGVLLDTAHLHCQKEILALSVEKLGKHILYVHVADGHGQIREHLAIGRGTIDWDSVFLTLKKHGYQGYVTIDVGRVPDLDAQILESRKALFELSARLDLGLEE